MDYPARRRDNLRRNLADDGVDCFLVSNPVNVTYLTNFGGESSCLAVTRDRAVLVSDFRFVEQIQEECPGLEAYIRPATQTLHAAVAHVLGLLGARAVAFESTHLTVADLETYRELCKAVEWKGVRDRVEQLRAVKDDSEIAALRGAIAVAEKAFAVFRALLRPQDTEKDLCDALESYVRRAGGKGTSFPSIVAVGDRAALPHAPPTGRTVAEAPLLLVDWGASGRLYKSDLTRTLATHKTAFFPETDAKLAEVYAVVLRAQEQAIARFRPGVPAREVDAAARSVIAEAGYGDYFGHGLGHGIGLQVHEAPAVRPNSETALRPGMVTTVEPGIYLPGWGGVRTEDDVLVTPDGCEVLTRVPRDFASMAQW